MQRNCRTCTCCGCRYKNDNLKIYRPKTKTIAHRQNKGSLDDQQIRSRIRGRCLEMHDSNVVKLYMRHRNNTNLVKLYGNPKFMKRSSVCRIKPELKRLDTHAMKSERKKFVQKTMDVIRYLQDLLN